MCKKIHTCEKKITHNANNSKLICIFVTINVNWIKIDLQLEDK